MRPARELLEIVNWLVWPERVGFELHRLQPFSAPRSTLMIPNIDAVRYTPTSSELPCRR